MTNGNEKVSGEEMATSEAIALGKKMEAIENMQYGWKFF
jgi:hypothetical protein